MLTLVRKHVEYTGSTRGQWVLDNWDDVVGKFVKVMPTDYKLALQEAGKKKPRRCVQERRARGGSWVMCADS